MKLDDTQKKTVAAWINEGAKLNDIQKRLATEFSITMTYMEVRMLVDDLKVMPKDPPAPVAPAPAPVPVPPQAMPDEEPPFAGDAPDATEPSTDLTGGRVTVTVDKLTRPGALVSGGVTFRDGVTAQWYLDQGGRLGLASIKEGYKPAAADVQAFQIELDKELRRLGL